MNIVHISFFIHHNEKPEQDLKNTPYKPIHMILHCTTGKNNI